MRLFCAVITICFFLLSLFTGTADIPLKEVLKVLCGVSDNEVFSVIVLQHRLPQALTAFCAGSALAVSGLIMQTVFANPLAGPSVLGISSASSLGAALVTFLFSSVLGGFNAALSVVIGSLIGSFVVLFLLVMLSKLLKNNLTLLIMGMMISYLSGALVNVLNFFADEESLKNFTVWTSGSFSMVSVENLKVFLPILLTFSFIAFLFVKPLNLLLLGENYALSLGVDVEKTKTLLLFISGVLTSFVTAFCGPVSFIGLCVPHIARIIFKTSDHKKLLPFTIVLGSCIALICNVLTILPAQRGILPLNAVTPIFGVPVIVYVLIKKSR